jgi:hypothetical protein
MQRVIFQWQPETNSVSFANVFDLLHEGGKDDWLLSTRQTPKPLGAEFSAGLVWEQAKQKHLALLESNAAIKQAFYAVNGDPVQMNGLPTSEITDMGDSYTLRCQRVAFQQWKKDMPWAKAGQVTVANGGDIAKESGLVPLAATQPQAGGTNSVPVVTSAPATPPMPKQPCPVASPINQGSIGDSTRDAYPSVPISSGNSDKIELLSQFGNYNTYVGAIRLSADGKLLAVGSRGAAEVFNRPSGAIVYRVEDPGNAPVNVEISPDSHLLAIGFRHEIKLVETTSFGVVLTIANPDGWPQPRFSPDGKFLVAKAKDNWVKIWEVETGREVLAMQGHGPENSHTWISDLAFSPDGSLLATSSYDQTVKVWNTSNGQLVKTLQGHTSEIYSVSFSPNGQYIASGENRGDIRIWDVASGQTVKILKGHTQKVLELVFSPDSRLLLSCAEDWSARLWDVNGGCELRLFGHGNQVYSTTFSPDMKLIATGTREAKVRLWGIR